MRRRLAVWTIGVGALALVLGGCGGSAKPKAPPPEANSAAGVLKSALTAAKEGDEAALLGCLAAPSATDDHPLRQLLGAHALQGVSWRIATVKSAGASQVGAYAVEFSAPVKVEGKSYRHLFAWVIVDTAANRAAQFGAARRRPGISDPTGRWAVASSELKNFDAKTSAEYFSDGPRTGSAHSLEQLLRSK
jgi:hypothetical protein